MAETTVLIAFSDIRSGLAAPPFVGDPAAVEPLRKATTFLDPSNF
jgi:hypothetical protein